MKVIKILKIILANITEIKYENIVIDDTFEMINKNKKQAEFFGKKIEEILIEVYTSYMTNEEIKDKTLIENVR